MPIPRFPIPQGTLDILILQIPSLEPAHGYGIAQRLEQISRSGGHAERKQSEIGHDAKFYTLTPASRHQLAVEKDSGARLSGAVNLIFEEGVR